MRDEEIGNKIVTMQVKRAARDIIGHTYSEWW